MTNKGQDDKSGSNKEGCRLRGSSTGSSSSGGPDRNHSKQQGRTSRTSSPALVVTSNRNQGLVGRGGKPCCFCWCCCCRCSCLGVKSGEDNSKNKDPNALDLLNCDGDPPPTLEEIRSWGDSFDKLMKSPAGRKVFRDFLKCEYSEENILFWQACEDLKKESNLEIVEEKARLIYEDYISILSPKEVSLDSRVREIINRNMVDPSKSTFDEAQVQIYTLMHRDSYPRFINSPVYKKLAQLNNHNGSTEDKNTPGTGTGSISRKQSSA